MFTPVYAKLANMKFCATTLLQCYTQVKLLTRFRRNQFPVFGVRYLFRPVQPPFTVAENFKHRIAIHDVNGDHTYDSIFQKSCNLAKVISNILGGAKKNPYEQDRIAFLCPNEVSYVIAQWAGWLSGNIVVPLHRNHPTLHLEYYIKDSQCALVVTTKVYEEKIAPITTKLNIRLLVFNFGQLPEKQMLPSTEAVVQDQAFFETADAMFLYTSGTTGPPKAAVLSHKNIYSMVVNMVDRWRWTRLDVILHALPLHHTHGVVNALLCPLQVGACVVLMQQFDAKEIWKRLLTTDIKEKRANIYMGVPTMYVKLLEEYDAQFAKHSRAREFLRATCKERIRLMVTGSSPLPEPIFKRWEEITGHQLLERYGMTETGMNMTMPLDGPRVPGYVGVPFPTVEVRIAKHNAYAPIGYDIIAEGTVAQTKVTPGMEYEEGELLVKGPSVFKGYWNKPEATKAAFTKDGWFKTGDTVIFQDGMYKIQGRTSVDILKCGGYKVSALDVERHLLSHPNIIDCVVVGVADVVYFQKIAAVVTLKDNSKQMTLSDLREWCKDRMAPYMMPTMLKIVDAMPRNLMGKVNKKDILKTMFGSEKPIK